MNYDKMNETVDKICLSLENRPDEWEITQEKMFGNTYFTHKSYNIRYCLEYGEREINKYGVFSHSQGEKIYKSYIQILKNKEDEEISIRQEKIIEAMKNPIEKEDKTIPIPKVYKRYIRFNSRTSKMEESDYPDFRKVKRWLKQI